MTAAVPNARDTETPTAERSGADTTRAIRLQDAERNRRLVLAEAAMVGERTMGIFRLVLLALLGLSQAAVALAKGTATQIAPERVIGVAIYAVLGVTSVIGVRRAKPNLKKAFYIPFWLAISDFGFMTWMDWCDLHQYGQVSPTLAGVARAVAICFSAMRFSLWHVAFSVFLAIASYLFAISMGGAPDLRTSAFVVAAFLALGAIIAWTAHRTGEMFTDIRRRDNLSRFLPRQVAERIITQGEASLAPTQRDVTVVFVDIRDFTALSEKLSPREVLTLLDEHLGEMANVVKKHDGVVNKFLGDGMLALWGVPDLNADHARLALKAALHLRAKMAELNALRAQAEQPSIRIGIGVHSGTVAAGMLGGADQHEYTVIGDAVNLASRVEGLTKQHGVDILVTQRTWELGGEGWIGRRIGEEQVKGRAEPVVVWALQGYRET
jgi:adenylate cyclase